MSLVCYKKNTILEQAKHSLAKARKMPVVIRLF